MKNSNNIKIKCAVSLLLLVVMMLVGCGKNTASDEALANTVGTRYVAEFMKSTGTDCNAVVDDLFSNVEAPYELAKMDVVPGYLNGFDNEIKGFDKGVVFSPMIGSIPFVGYVFETENPEALEEELKASANLRWNICTEADEMVSSINGKLVFFMMCTNEE